LQGKIDLLLTDVILPGISGPEIAERIVNQSPGIQVLFMSGYPDDRIAEHGVIRSGINFISKPIIIQELSVKLKNMLLPNM